MSKRTTIKKEWLPYVYEIFTTRKDLNKDEKAELLNKKFQVNLGESAWRKKAKSYGAGIQDGLEDNASDDELKRIAKAQVKAMLEQKKATLMKTDIHRKLRQVGTKELILNMIEESVKERYKGIEKIKIKVDKNKKQQWVIRLTISDVHYTGLKDNPRISKIFENVIKTLQRYNIVNKNTRIIMSFLGDDVEGFLHKGQALDVTMLTIQQALNLAPLYWKGIQEVNNFTRKEYGVPVEVEFVRESNHGQTRQMGSQRGEFAKEDVGFIIARELKTHIEYTHDDNKIIFTESGDDGTIVDEGTKTVLGHGDKPWMKNANSIKAYIPKGYNSIFGHWHHLKVEQFEDRFLMWSPAAKDFRNQYESELGVSSDNGIGVVLYKDGICEGMSVSRIEG